MKTEVEANRPFKLLIVCTGNTCRSPLAAAIARQFVADRGWTGMEVRSAGVAASPGAPASSGSLRAAERHGLELEGHRSAQLDAPLVQWADLILTMSPGQLVGVELLGGGKKGWLITDFAQGDDASVTDSRGVSDPFGGSDERYEETFKELQALIGLAIERLATAAPP